MRTFFLSIAILTIVVACSESHDPDAGHDDHHWEYGNEMGPAQWGSLNPDFATCDTGQEQSPVNITGALSGDSTIAIRRDLQPVNVALVPLWVGSIL